MSLISPFPNTLTLFLEDMRLLTTCSVSFQTPAAVTASQWWDRSLLSQRPVLRLHLPRMPRSCLHYFPQYAFHSYKRCSVSCTHCFFCKHGLPHRRPTRTWISPWGDETLTLITCTVLIM